MSAAVHGRGGCREAAIHEEERSTSRSLEKREKKNLMMMNDEHTRLIMSHRLTHSPSTQPWLVAAPLRLVESVTCYNFLKSKKS